MEVMIAGCPHNSDLHILDHERFIQLIIGVVLSIVRKELLDVNVELVLADCALIDEGLIVCVNVQDLVILVLLGEDPLRDKPSSAVISLGENNNQLQKRFHFSFSLVNNYLDAEGGDDDRAC
eukprot:TRINITY_DN10254_c0_g1_i2.p2 TRINITY_DN10254_c0_g1~~TRINITY_DN10254_c0_g1_i2.p2  ORF type:complete len:122 (+),score=5.52 TRINITY_DN10254_c0_g1_i2:219-584(+)